MKLKKRERDLSLKLGSSVLLVNMRLPMSCQKIRTTQLKKQALWVMPNRPV